jgi:NAD(P)H dehydrogenase (quinone)
LGLRKFSTILNYLIRHSGESLSPLASVFTTNSAEESAMKILVVYYSMYGHILKMAEAVAEGAAEVPGARVEIRRTPETLPDTVLEKMGALNSIKQQARIPICTVEELGNADAVIFGTPTRYGNMCGQMRQFLDATGQLWVSGALVGKAGSVFTSSATQHGGQESTILSTHTTLLHLGMVIVGLPYSFQEQMRMDEITGCSPYGASTIAGGKGERMPSVGELAGARYQGKHVAGIAARLCG